MACLTFTTTATPPPPHNKTPPPPPLLTHSVQIVGEFCGGAKDNDDEEKNYNSKLLLFGCAINYLRSIAFTCHNCGTCWWFTNLFTDWTILHLFIYWEIGHLFAHSLWTLWSQILVFVTLRMGAPKQRPLKGWCCWRSGRLLLMVVRCVK